MTYTVKEIFRTLQGEGAHLGRPAVFVRFSGCNLWSGREEDRASARCTFCDTDFVGGEKFSTSDELRKRVDEVAQGIRWLVLTGGEPGLQVDRELVSVLQAWGYWVAIETNGTVSLPPNLDWVCVSPKETDLKQTKGDELKLVFPQPGIDPASFVTLDFDRFKLSPMDGPNLTKNTAAAIEYCLANPRWSMTIQAHKFWGIR